MQTINFKNENRGQGLTRALDQLWDSWKLLDKGTLNETNETFTLTNTNGDTFVAAKTGEPFAAKMYNRHYETDKGIFEVYEGQNPTGGYFLLYRFKDNGRRNEFVISSIGGVAEGSSIHFEIEPETKTSVSPTSSSWRKQNFNSQELGLISMSYMKNLFPKPKAGELLNDKGDGNGGFAFYYENSYYEKYKGAFQTSYNSGAFVKSNSERDWNDLMSKVLSAQPVDIANISNLEEYWLNEK